jgi:hypothetical protein
LVFNGGYPALAIGMALTRTASEVGERIRYERACVCCNGGCDYRKLVGED